MRRILLSAVGAGLVGGLFGCSSTQKLPLSEGPPPLPVPVQTQTQTQYLSARPDAQVASDPVVVPASVTRISNFESRKGCKL